MEIDAPPIEPPAVPKSSRTSPRTSSRGSRVELITRGEPRRRWSTEQKQAIAAKSFEPGVSSMDVAREYGISSSNLTCCVMEATMQPHCSRSPRVPGHCAGGAAGEHRAALRESYAQSWLHSSEQFPANDKWVPAGFVAESRVCRDGGRAYPDQEARQTRCAENLMPPPQWVTRRSKLRPVSGDQGSNADAGDCRSRDIGRVRPGLQKRYRRPGFELADPDPDREMSCRLDRARNVSRAMNSSATCRLNATLWERCLAMASILQKPDMGGQIMEPKLSTRRGALHPAGQKWAVLSRGYHA